MDFEKTCAVLVKDSPKIHRKNNPMVAQNFNKIILFISIFKIHKLVHL